MNGPRYKKLQLALSHDFDSRTAARIMITLKASGLLGDAMAMDKVVAYHKSKQQQRTGMTPAQKIQQHKACEDATKAIEERANHIERTTVGRW